MKRQLLYELRCKCGEFFLYCHKRKGDFRCDKCRGFMTVEEVEQELREMDMEEYIGFMEEIREYEEKHGIIEVEDEE